jgi:N-acetylmuramoyl-L-alanine amidase
MIASHAAQSIRQVEISSLTSTQSWHTNRRIFVMRPRILFIAALSLFVSHHSGKAREEPGTRTLLPPNVHGRLVRRTMRPQFITIHSTGNREGTAAQHAHLLLSKGIRSKNNPRFGRSGWVTWHYTVDDRLTAQHLLATEQGDHADYGGPGDRSSIGIEICEFRSARRQAAALDRAARLAAVLANQYGIPASRIVPHKHWPRWDFKYGKPCPRILLQRDSKAPGGWRTGAKWARFMDAVARYR